MNYINSNAKAIYQLGIWRCDGPERHEMLTVINAYYSCCFSVLFPNIQDISGLLVTQILVCVPNEEMQ